MLNKNVINMLQSLNGITNSGILKYPTTILNNSAGDVVVKVNLESLDPESFDNIGIYNLSEFISIFKLFGSDYTCNISDGIINVTSGNNSVQYLTTNLAVLENHDKDEKIFSSTESVPTICSVKLTIEDLKTIKSASSVFKELTDIVFISKDNDLTIKLGSTNNFNANSNSFSVKKPNVDGTKEFTVKIPADNFNALPLGEYTLEFKYNEQRDAYRVIIKSTEVDITVLMAVKK